VGVGDTRELGERGELGEGSIVKVEQDEERGDPEELKLGETDGEGFEDEETLRLGSREVLGRTEGDVVIEK